METPDNSIDFVPVSVEEAAKVDSPAISVLKGNTTLDEKFSVASMPVAKLVDIAKAEAITKSLQSSPSSPETIQDATPKNPKAEQKMSDSDKAYQELIKRYPEIEGANLGQARKIIEADNTKHGFGDIEKFMVPTVGLGMGVILANVSSIPAYISVLAAGPTGVVTGMGMVVAGTFGIFPIVAGASFIAYEGYKFIRNIQENRRNKKDQKKLDAAWKIA